MVSAPVYGAAYSLHDDDHVGYIFKYFLPTCLWVADKVLVWLSFPRVVSSSLSERPWLAENLVDNDVWRVLFCFDIPCYCPMSCFDIPCYCPMSCFDIPCYCPMPNRCMCILQHTPPCKRALLCTLVFRVDADTQLFFNVLEFWIHGYRLTLECFELMAVFLNVVETVLAILYIYY